MVPELSVPQGPGFLGAGARGSGLHLSLRALLLRHTWGGGPALSLRAIGRGRPPSKGQPHSLRRVPRPLKAASLHSPCPLPRHTVHRHLCALRNASHGCEHVLTLQGGGDPELEGYDKQGLWGGAACASGLDNGDSLAAPHGVGHLGGMWLLDKGVPWPPWAQPNNP